MTPISKPVTRVIKLVCAVLPLVVLAGGCTTTRAACWAQGGCRTDRDGVLVVTRTGEPVTEEERAKRASFEDLRARAIEDNRKEAERRAEERRAAQAKRAEEAAAQEETLRARIASDEARGYKQVSFADFILDYKTMPIGSKRAVHGYYRVFGNFETLTEVPYGDNPPRVVLLTDSAPREVRAVLQSFQCRQGLCKGVLLGHTVRCTITWAGNPMRSDVCLAVDGMRP